MWSRATTSSPWWPSAAPIDRRACHARIACWIASADDSRGTTPRHGAAVRHLPMPAAALHQTGRTIRDGFTLRRGCVAIMHKVCFVEPSCPHGLIQKFQPVLHWHGGSGLKMLDAANIGAQYAFRCQVRQIFELALAKLL